MSSVNNYLYEPYISRYMSVDINGNWAPRTINKEQTINIFVSAAAAQTLDREICTTQKWSICLLFSVSTPFGFSEKRKTLPWCVVRRVSHLTLKAQNRRFSLACARLSFFFIRFDSLLFGSTLAAPMSRKENGTKCERRRRKRNTLPCYS